MPTTPDPRVRAKTNLMLGGVGVAQCPGWPPHHPINGHNFRFFICIEFLFYCFTFRLIFVSCDKSIKIESVKRSKQKMKQNKNATRRRSIGIGQWEPTSRSPPSNPNPNPIQRNSISSRETKQQMVQFDMSYFWGVCCESLAAVAFVLSSPWLKFMA